jgi:hypothetical protein
VIAALPLVGNTASPTSAALLLLDAVLREPSTGGRAAIPDEATTAEATAFVPTR